MPTLLDLGGQRFGRLSVIERAENAREGKPQWVCRCTCGSAKVVRAAALRSGAIRSCGCLSREIKESRRGARNPLYSPVPTYGGAHDRVRRERGPASALACVGCGKQAQEWSYDLLDPNEAIDERGRRFSCLPTHYVARCRPCHRAFDRAEGGGSNVQR